MNDALPGRLPGCPTDLDLELALAGDTEAGRLHGGHTGTCASCGDRLSWMRRAGEAFDARVFPATRERVVRAVVPAKVRWLWVAFPAAAACAAAAALVLARPAADYVGAKGGDRPSPVLEVYVGEAGHGRRLEPGDVVHPGDGLRFAIRGAGSKVLLLTLDATGRVSRIYPAGPVPVPADGVLPGGAVLDAVIGPERVFAVQSDGALTYEQIEAAVRRALPEVDADSVRLLERLPVDAPQDSLLLEKLPK